MLLKKIERTFRQVVLRGLKRLFPVEPLGVESARTLLDRGEISKILFIGPHQGLGQFLCATPLFRALKETWPAVGLHFVGNPTNAAIAQANSCLERVWIWQKSSLVSCLRLVRSLKKEKYSMAMLLTTEMPSTTGLMVARLSGAIYVAGYAPSAPGWENLSGLYHLAIPYQHVPSEVDKFLGLVRALGVHSSQHTLEFVVRNEDLNRAHAFLQREALLEKRPRVGLFLGGKVSRPGRLWPVAHFARLASQLQAYKMSLIAISPPADGTRQVSFRSGESHRLDEFMKLLQVPCVIFQEKNLALVAAFLKTLDLLICPDGGIMHLAAAVGTPTLALFFDTDPQVWHHEGNQQHYLSVNDEPPSSLSPEQVFRKALEVLKTLPVMGV